jgi:hypothetical protein
MVVVHATNKEEGIEVYLSGCAIGKRLKLSQIRELFQPILDGTTSWKN